MRRNAKKALLAALCVAAIVTVSVFATLAYFTDTQTVTNTFTVGNVTITMDEAKVTEYGVAVADAERVTENSYKLIPGQTYGKDPTVHVAADSEDCWLFVKVENGLASVEHTIARQLAANGWTPVAGETNVYGYRTRVAGGAEIPVFTQFTVDEDADADALQAVRDASIALTAYAVQAVGLDTAAEAWRAAKNA